MSCELCDIDHCIFCDDNLNSDHFHTIACALREIIRTKTYKPGEVIFQKNESSTYLYILKNGRVKLTSLMPGGREQIIGLITPGQLLGVDTLSDEFYPYSATAVDTTTVCEFRHNAMLHTLKEHPAITAHLVDDLNVKLKQTRALIEANGHKSAVEKVAACILYTQPQDELDTEQSAIQLSRKELSEILGLTIETISRIIAELLREGVIETPQRGIIIRDRKRLQDIADDNLTSRKKSSRHLQVAQ